MSDSSERRPGCEIGHRPVLTSQQTWERLFETRLPSRNVANEIVGSLVAAVTNFPPLLQLETIGGAFLKFKGNEVNNVNVIPIPFLFGVEPYQLLSIRTFSKENPRAIKIIDKHALDNLEARLRENKILSKNGELAGAVLFTHKEDTFIKPRTANGIGIGVVDKDTSQPLGIVFCSEEILPYMFDDSEGSKRTRKKKVVFQKAPELVPVYGGADI